jgi:topoisomerase IV subunit B
VFNGIELMLSVFIRNPHFQSQTKDRLTSLEAARFVEAAVRDHFDHFLADNMDRGRALLGNIVERMEERLKRRAEREVKRKTATSARKLRLPGKLTDCANDDAAGHRIVHRRGRQRRRLGQAGARPQDPGDPPHPRQDPQRRLGHPDKIRANSEIADLAAGARLRHPRQVRRGCASLRAHHHHDRRRRRRRPYRHLADDLLLPGNARSWSEAGTCSSPSRRSTA